MLYLLARRSRERDACAMRAAARAIAIASALEKIPSEPEYGEICFHEADEEQLACMFETQSTPAGSVARRDGGARSVGALSVSHVDDVRRRRSRSSRTIT